MKLTILIIFFMTVLVNFLYAENTNTLISIGDTYHRKFNNIDALKYYQFAYEQDPENFEILKKLTLTANDCGEDLVETNESKAKEYFKLSVKYAELSKINFPEQKDNYLLLGLSYGNSSRYASGKSKVTLARNVERNFKKMVEHRPDYAPPYIGLGIYYREVSKINFILKLFAKNLLGGLPDGSLEDSKAMLLKAVELAPNKVFTHYELAITYLDLGDTKKVEYHLVKVLELPNSDHLDPLKKKTAEKILLDLNS